MTGAMAGAIAEFVAPPQWRCIDFISDLHLSEETPGVTAAWSAYLEGTRADAVFILGDLFEAWLGDDARHVGFEARCAEVLRAASKRRYVAFMAGNRDFLLGPDMLAACGMHPLADPTLLVAQGDRLLLSHGDALCLADVDYQRLRAVVRQPAWQQEVLARPLAERRQLARHMRTESERHHRAGNAQPNPVWFDIDVPTALEWMERAGASVLIHGHTHRPGDETLAPGRLRRVLSDWDRDGALPPRGDVLRWQPDGISRLSPEAAATGD